MKRNIRTYTITVLLITIILMTSCISRKTENESPSAIINIYPALSELVDENNFYARWTKSIDPEGQAITYIVNFAKTMEGLDDLQYYETKENYFLMPSTGK